jgi:hypothetical protein
MIPLGTLPMYANTYTFTNTKGYVRSLEYLMWNQI